MTRIERIIKNARITLADKDGERWDDTDLLAILSEGQRDLCLHTQVLNDRMDIAIEEGKAYYTLPDDLWLLTRVTFMGRSLPMLSHDDLDEKTLARFNLGYGIDMSPSDWENSTGTPLAIVYDRRNVNEIKLFPTPDSNVMSQQYTLNMPGGVTTQVDAYELLVSLGVVTSTTDEIPLNSVLGVLSGFEGPSTIKCYYVKVPNELETTQDLLETPAIFDTALKYYVVGHAFLNDLAQEYQTKGTQQLALYERELEVVTKTSVIDGTRAAQFTTSYRSAF